MKTIVLAAALLTGGAAGASQTCEPLDQRISRALPVVEKAAATAQVRALFDAAGEGDEAAFTALLAAVPNVNDYRIDGDALLHRLLQPAPSLAADEAAWRKNSAGQEDDAHWAGQQRKHAALYAARTRMLARALQAGATVNAAGASGATPLHLAALFGTADMVRMLIRAGADVRQVGTAAVEYEPLVITLRQDIAGALEGIVAPDVRTAVMLALMDAGAPLPGQQVEALDDCYRKLGADRAGESVDAARPDVDFRWGSLLAWTRGQAVLDRMLALGSRPYLDEGASYLFAHAASVGNVDGVAWLQAHVPRYDDDGRDTWVDGAVWALQAPHEASDAILDRLLVPDLRWQQKGPARVARPANAWRHVPRDDMAQATLPGRAILAGRGDVVRRLARLGVPLGADETALLADVVIAGDVEMLRTLLALGVSPLSGDPAALDLAAVAPATLRYREFDPKREPALARRKEMLALLLEAMRQQKLAVPEGSRLLEWALEYATTTERASLARMVLDAGVPVRNLRGGIDAALRSPDRALFGELLKHGYLAPPTHGFDGRAAYAGVIVRDALLAGRTDVLPALLALRPDLGRRSDGKPGPIDEAIGQGDIAIVEMLLAAGGELDAGAFHSAIAAGHAGMTRFVAAKTGLAIATGCNGDATALARMVRSADNAYWTLLREQGFGARSCPDLAPRLVTAFAQDEPALYAGWIGERMRRRMADLYADDPAQANTAATALLLQSPRLATLAKVLQGAGWPAPAAPAMARQSAADRVLARKLPGLYRVFDDEVLSFIRLERDGRCWYEMHTDRVREELSCRWAVEAGRLRLTGKPAPAAPLYTPIDNVPADLPPAGQLQVTVYYQESRSADLRVAVLGDQPVAQHGVTTTTGWRGAWTGPVRQIVFAHKGIDGGRPFVFDVPPAQATHSHFTFRLPDNIPNRALDERLSIRGTTLVASGETGELIYQRVPLPKAAD